MMTHPKEGVVFDHSHGTCRHAAVVRSTPPMTLSDAEREAGVDASAGAAVPNTF